MNAGRGALLPQVNASAGVSRPRSSGIEQGIDNPMFVNTYNLYQGGLGASYDLHVFGKTRRRIEQTEARLDFARYQVLDAYVTLVNNIVATAIAQAGVNAALATTHEIIDSARRRSWRKQSFMIGLNEMYFLAGCVFIELTLLIWLSRPNE